MQSSPTLKRKQVNGLSIIQNTETYGPNITKKRAEDVPQDQEKWRGVKDKLKYFSEKPGKRRLRIEICQEKKRKLKE